MTTETKVTEQLLDVEWSSDEFICDPGFIKVKLTEEVIATINRHKKYAKENEVSVSIPFYDYEFLDEHQQPFSEWRADVTLLKVSQYGGVWFYAQNKWDSSIQIEAQLDKLMK